MISRMGKTFTFRADPDLAAVLQDEASARGVAVSRIVRDACRERLGLDGADVDRRRFNRFRATNAQQAAS